MSKITVKYKDNGLSKAIQLAMARCPAETVKAVKKCALDLSGKSAKRAPIESGDLRNNCHAELNGVTVFEKQTAKGAPVPTNKATASVGYSLPYALRQHEELGYRHDRTDGSHLNNGNSYNLISGGEAKYLERPFNENVQKYTQIMDNIVERSLK